MIFFRFIILGILVSLAIGIGVALLGFLFGQRFWIPVAKALKFKSDDYGEVNKKVSEIFGKK